MGFSSGGSGGGGGVDISARAFHSAAQSIPDNTTTSVALNSERWDTDGIHDNVTNNSRLTAQTAGKYIITGHVSWASNATGIRQVAIRLNGATGIAQTRNATGDGRHQSIATVYDFAVNDYVEMRVVQVSGGALNLDASGNISPEFTLTKVLG